MFRASCSEPRVLSPVFRACAQGAALSGGVFGFANEAPEIGRTALDFATQEFLRCTCRTAAGSRKWGGSLVFNDLCARR